MPVKRKLNIDVGCGGNKYAGYVGMDVRPLPAVDVVHDAEQFPWPFEDGTATVIRMCHFMEHVKPWLSIELMNEAWRLLEPDGLLWIIIPYGGSPRYYQDPTHCNPWTEVTFGYFDPNHRSGLYYVYKPRPWGIERLYWMPYGDIEAVMRKVEPCES